MAAEADRPTGGGPTTCHPAKQAKYALNFGCLIAKPGPHLLTCRGPPISQPRGRPPLPLTPSQKLLRAADWEDLYLASSGVVVLVVSGNARTHVASRQANGFTAIVVERSGPAIRAVLSTHAPERCAQFEAELRSALARAAEDFDLSGPQEVLRHWHAVATMAVNPLTDDERDQIERAKAGDFTGLSEWVRL